MLARGLALKLSEALGQSVIVESRPGANGIVGAQRRPLGPRWLHHAADTGSHTASHVAKNLPYDALKDFAPITQLAGSYGLALITTRPFNTVAELVAAAKAKPGTLSYGTSGIGNLTHVSGRLFEVRAGISRSRCPTTRPRCCRIPCRVTSA